MPTTVISSVLDVPRDAGVMTSTGACRLCGLLVPFDEAVVPETVDYLMFFCGLACYEQWRRAAGLALGTKVASAP